LAVILVSMVVARASLALTCASIRASQSTLVVVLVPDVVVELAELVLVDVAVVAVELVLLTDVMAESPNRRTMGRQQPPAL
jgi:hypothetical protein